MQQWDTFPSGIFNAVGHTHILAIQQWDTFLSGIFTGNPVIPGNPVFEFVPAAQILNHLFSIETVGIVPDLLVGF